MTYAGYRENKQEGRGLLLFQGGTMGVVILMEWFLMCAAGLQLESGYPDHLDGDCCLLRRRDGSKKIKIPIKYKWCALHAD